MNKSTLLLAGLCLSATLLPASTVQERLRDSAAVLHEVESVPEKGIPRDLLQKAYCAVVVPSLKKGAFVVGAEYGRGFVICRKGSGIGWGAPAAIRVEGGSFGFQIGGSATEVVMLIMNERGMHQLEKDKFTLGGDASIAAGPVGRTVSADTDAYMSADILSWSRTKGLFAGLALKGATLRPDRDANRELYGRELGTREIVMVPMRPTPAAHPLVAELDRYTR